MLHWRMDEFAFDLKCCDKIHFSSTQSQQGAAAWCGGGSTWLAPMARLPLWPQWAQAQPWSLVALWWWCRGTSHEFGSQMWGKACSSCACTPAAQPCHPTQALHVDAQCMCQVPAMGASPPQPPHSNLCCRAAHGVGLVAQRAGNPIPNQNN